MIKDNARSSIFIRIVLFFILIQPVFDVAIYFANSVMGINSILISLIRPAFAVFLYVYLLIRYPLNRKEKIISVAYMVIYGAYSLFYIVNLKSHFFSGSFGTMTDEIRYLSNYAYFILQLMNFFFILKYSSAQEKESILKTTVYAIGTLSFLYLLSIITGTSPATYGDTESKFGFRGWSISAHYIAHSTLLSLPIVLDVLYERKLIKGWYKHLLFLFIVGLPYYLVGTKTSVLGIALVLFGYVVIKLACLLLKKCKLNRESAIAMVICTVLIVSFPLTPGFGNLQFQLLVGKSKLHGNDVNFIRNVLTATPTPAVIDGTTDFPTGTTPQATQTPDAAGSNANAFQNRVTGTMKYFMKKVISASDNRQIQFALNQRLKSISPVSDQVLGYGYVTLPKNTWVETDTLRIYFSNGYIGFLLIICIPFGAVLFLLLKAIIRCRRPVIWLYGLGACMGLSVVTFVGYTLTFPQTAFYLVLMLSMIATRCLEVIKNGKCPDEE